MTHLTRLCLLLTAAAGATASPAAARVGNEVRVAMVYNFLRYAEFPGNGARIVVCVQNGDPIAGALAKLNGRMVGAARTQVVTLPQISGDTSGCQVIYAGHASPPQTATGQITIGDGADFVRRGGTIGLVEFGDQLRFAVNLGSARAARVTLRSQMLRLATNVID